ncbi:MAG: hypothetical protein QXZ06_02530 [Candidatus Jordarchaeales archaeon]
MGENGTLDLAELETVAHIASYTKNFMNTKDIDMDGIPDDFDILVDTYNYPLDHI